MDLLKIGHPIQLNIGTAVSAVGAYRRAAAGHHRALVRVAEAARRVAEAMPAGIAVAGARCISVVAVGPPAAAGTEAVEVRHDTAALAAVAAERPVAGTAGLAVVAAGPRVADTSAVAHHGTAGPAAVAV